MSDNVNRIIQKARIGEERAERLLEEMAVMQEQIDSLTRELAEAREALANDYVLKSEAWDGCQKSAKKARDKALEEAAKALDAWGDIYGDNAAKTVRALKEKP